MPAEKKPKKDDTEKNVPSAPPVFDVSKPGETAANPSSKPIIVSHKPMLKQDPMMKSEDGQDKEERKDLPKAKKETKIEPVSEIQPEDKAEDKPAEDSELDNDEKAVVEGSPDSGSSAIDALADEVGSKKADQKARDDAKKKQIEVDKIIASKKYNLPIHDGVVARSGIGTVFINIVLSLLVVVAGVVLAVDAGYLNIPIELPFDLIK
jgi:hypothetical protein